MAKLPVVLVMEDIAQIIPININIQSASGGASMASQAMVSSSSEPVTGQTMGASHQTGSPLSAERVCLASGSGSSSALVLVTESSSLLVDCEPVVIHTIGKDRAPSTRQIYTARWRIFSFLCGD